jgi:uncharacterized membrane protein
MNGRPTQSPLTRSLLIIVLLAAFCLTVFTTWLLLTPSGLLGKLQALAYSVCHENPDHSLQIGLVLLPLCARCTGMFLGCLLGLVTLLLLTRSAGYPTKKIMWALGALVFFFAVDGVDSAVFSFFNGQSLYAPSNLLRLVSGLGMGLVLAVVILSLWRQTMAQTPDLKAGLSSWKQLMISVVVQGALAGLITFAPTWMYYPLAILSVLSVPFLLTMVYTLLWILMRKKENSLRNLQQRFTYILLGCLSAFIQIGAFDLLRFMLTGSWAGIRF